MLKTDQMSQARPRLPGVYYTLDFSLPGVWLVVGVADSLEAPDLLTHLLSICSSAHALILRSSSPPLPDCLVSRVGGTSHTALCELFHVLFSPSATVISFAQNLPVCQLRKSSFLIILLKSTNLPHWYSPPVAFCLETKSHLVQLTLRAVVSLFCLLLSLLSNRKNLSVLALILIILSVSWVLVVYCFFCLLSLCVLFCFSLPILGYLSVFLILAVFLPSTYFCFWRIFNNRICEDKKKKHYPCVFYHLKVG